MSKKIEKNVSETIEQNESKKIEQNASKTIDFKSYLNNMLEETKLMNTSLGNIINRNMMNGT